MKLKITAALIIGIISLVLAVSIGSVYIPPGDVFRIIMNNIFGANLPEHITDGQSAIIWYSRLPRALLAFCAGAALSVSGAVMQSVLRNPLASSYTLGVSSGASLGASLVIFMGFSLPLIPLMTLPILGFSFGLGTILLVIGVSSRIDRRMENHTIILFGMVISLFINSVTTLIFAFYREGVQRMVFWQMGSFSLRDWQPVYILAAIGLVGIIFITRFKWQLDIMTFGEEQAHTVGVSVKRTKLILLVSAAALTGSTIAFVGVIGFVDLVAPHIVRRIYGSAHKYVIPMSAVAGGAFMVLSDLAARTVTSPVELPVGAVTAIIGAPFFAYIYFGGRKKRAGA
jgi:iron complex transport system permease protein